MRATSLRTLIIIVVINTVAACAWVVAEVIAVAWFAEPEVVVFFVKDVASSSVLTLIRGVLLVAAVGNLVPMLWLMFVYRPLPTRSPLHNVLVCSAGSLFITWVMFASMLAAFPTPFDSDIANTITNFISMFGFVGNQAAIAFAVEMSWRIKRRRRKASHCCEACGYPMTGTSQRCSECNWDKPRL